MNPAILRISPISRVLVEGEAKSLRPGKATDGECRGAGKDPDCQEECRPEGEEEEVGEGEDEPGELTKHQEALSITADICTHLTSGVSDLSLREATRERPRSHDQPTWPRREQFTEEVAEREQHQQ